MSGRRVIRGIDRNVFGCSLLANGREFDSGGYIANSIARANDDMPGAMLFVPDIET
jgi:hypothetical protein